MKNQYLVCIAKYAEDISWVPTFKDTLRKDLNIEADIKVYDKSTGDYQNVGREAETFLLCIIEHYDILNQYQGIIFLQGYPFDHLPQRDLQKKQLTEYVRHFQVSRNPVPIGTLHVSDAMGRPDHPGLPVGEMWRRRVSGASRAHWTFCAGAQYIVAPSHILQYPVDFWKAFHQDVWRKIICPWTAERFWLELFSYSEDTGEIKPKTKTQRST